MDFPVATADDYSRRVELDERRADTLNVRVPKSLKTELESLADYFTERDRAVNREARGTTVGDVVVRLLRVGLEGAWTQTGLKARPTREEIENAVRSMKSPS